MELPSEEGGEMPIPINSSYGGGQGHHGHGGHGQHMIHHDPPAPHNHIIPVSSAPQMPSINGPPISSALLDQDHSPPYKKVVRYRECLKNHAAAMGGNATDGCGEFMPSGEEGTIEALTCSACNCHRNFHRKEVEGEQPPLSSPFECYTFGRKLILGHHQKSFPGHESLGFHTGTLISSRAAPQQMIMAGYNNMGSFLPYSDQSDDQQEDGGGGGCGSGGATRPPQMMTMKKRFRTKFTPEQKEKMLQFAEKVGWKIQKQEESVVQQFCQEVGVKRRVLKVWMHNNKHNLAKKNINEIAQDQV